jgi:hypothetical protein
MGNPADFSPLTSQSSINLLEAIPTQLVQKRDSSPQRQKEKLALTYNVLSALTTDDARTTDPTPNSSVFSRSAITRREIQKTGLKRTHPLL